MNFSYALISWYQSHKRDLPWRGTSNPYYIWLSEIILQQTRVVQGLPYYYKFIDRFPTVHDLASASQDEVLKLWQGLGYYSRARNLHVAAQQVVAMGAFPNQFKDLLQLKGVGEYTAAAVASFAYKEPVAVVDGNVYRVLSRVHGIHDPINQPVGARSFKTLANKLLDTKQPDIHNQAIMEFGALQCVPKNPDCSVCPFNAICVAYNDQLISVLPVKIKKTKIKKLHHHYMVLHTSNHKTLLLQRPQKGIWAGLYEFPYIETSGSMTVQELKGHPLVKEMGLVRFRESLHNLQPIIHKLSHRHIYAYFWILHTDQSLPNATPIQEVFNKPVPVLIDRFMKSYWNTYL